MGRVHGEEIIVTFLDRYRYWIAQPLLERLRQELIQTAVDRQREAYDLGRIQGMAIGQLQGQQYLLSEMSRFLDERHAESPEISREDIERAKKGMVH